MRGILDTFPEKKKKDTQQSVKIPVTCNSHEVSWSHGNSSPDLADNPLVFEIPLHETSVKYDPICFQEAKESDLSPKKGTSPHYETCAELDQKIKDDPADSSKTKNQVKKDHKDLPKGCIEEIASGNTQLAESVKSDEINRDKKIMAVHLSISDN